MLQCPFLKLAKAMSTSVIASNTSTFFASDPIRLLEIKQEEVSITFNHSNAASLFLCSSSHDQLELDDRQVTIRINSSAQLASTLQALCKFCPNSKLAMIELTKAQSALSESPSYSTTPAIPR